MGLVLVVEVLVLMAARGTVADAMGLAKIHRG